MRGVFDDGEREPLQPSRDTELTLGSGTLLAMFFGLVLICGLCFGLGYAVGRHGSGEATAAMPQSATAAQTSFQANGSLSKPSAIVQPVSAAATQSAGAYQAPAAANANPAASSQTALPNASTGASPGQPQVQPALAAPANSPQPAQPAAAQNVHPALAQPVQLMVQIAAVANPEDGEVLVNALRKRGYTVVARREPADNLIHVRIGPFSSREDANRWRQKLLNDGYNAIVMP